MRKYKRREFLKGLGLLGAGALAGSLASRIAQAYTVPQVERIISPRHPDFPADVIVYRDGDYAVAVDHKGNQIAKSTDHAEVIQKAIDHVAGLGGGKIHISEGPYSLNRRIEIIDKENIIIEGDGFSTILNFTQTDSGNGIYVYFSAVTERVGVIIKNIKIVGNNGAGNGIYMYQAYRSRIENVWVEGFGGHGIYMEKCWDSKLDFVISRANGGDGVYIYNLTNSIHLSKVIATSNSGHGISIVSSTGITLSSCSAENNSLEQIYISASHSVSVITSYVTHAPADYAGILVTGTPAIPSDAINIIGCWIRDNAGYGIWIASNVNSVNVVGTSFENNNYSVRSYPNGQALFIGCDFKDTNIVTSDTINTKFVRCRGYITENSGVVTVTGDGATTTFTVDIDHGLVSDKVAVKLACKKSATFKWYLVDTDSDGFYETIRVEITFDSAPADGEEVEIYWEAEVVG